ncbi:MAG: hypothetical protein A3H31_00455 [Gallionellales bacterium RIFCSPLOWO2_02_FULL_57_47]|nr:MAG: hypothetical protein A3H31_00455 [Gallionellales bacterium RIFCSPLOWO2_02_FULL_57_47]
MKKFVFWESAFCGRFRPLLFPLAVFSVFAGLTLAPLWGQAGWPLNHELNMFAQRTQIYAQHYSFLDFLPIWSSVDNEGFGSPQPLFYHKLFYVVSASLLNFTGAMKAALVMAILIFLVAGAFGMYCTLRALGASRDAGVAGGLSIIVAKYTVTNWLIRGALAEFSAAMLVPWALLYFIRTVQEERVHPGFAVSLGLIFLAHSVICFYLVLLFSVTILVLLAVRRIRLGILSARSLLLPTAVFLALVGPSLLAMSVLSGDYDMGRIVPDHYHPNSQFQPLGRYFWDGLWSFGDIPNGFTVQIDLPPMLLITAGLFGILLNNQTGLSTWGQRRATLMPVLPFFLLGALAFVLQLPISAPFYAHFPGAKFIQFPWRLLAVITPIVIVVGLYLTEKTFSLRLTGVVLAIYLVIMVIICGAFAPNKYQGLQSLDYSPGRVIFSLFDEYVPKAAPLPSPTRERVLAGAEAAGCYIDHSQAIEEVNRMQFRISCVRPALLALPIFASRLHSIVVFHPDGTSRPGTCEAALGFPGLCGVWMPAGQSQIQVEMPSYQSIVRWLIGWLFMGNTL